MRRLVLWVLVAALILGVPPGQATHQQSDPVQQGPENDFGRVDWKDPYPRSDGDRVPVGATIELKDWDGGADMAYVLLAFNVKTDAMTVELTDIQTPDGQDVPLHADDRGDQPRMPKVIVAAEDLENGTVVLRGAVAAEANGRFHLGAMAIGFDDEFSKLLLPGGYSAEVYGSAEVASEGVPGGPLQPPLRGDSNEVHVPGFGVGAVVAAVGVAAWRVTAGTRRP